jgi:hypothetical protein
LQSFLATAEKFVHTISSKPSQDLTNKRKVPLAREFGDTIESTSS